ncbi:hypothetical protein D3C81_1850270 [compost metagenome]
MTKVLRAYGVLGVIQRANIRCTECKHIADDEVVAAVAQREAAPLAHGRVVQGGVCRARVDAEEGEHLAALERYRALALQAVAVQPALADDG